MEKRRRVVVYGNSLNMAGIVASLKADASLEVLCVNIDSPEALQSVDENDITAIIFDLGEPPLRLDITLLRDLPGLLLIGLDPSRDEMLVLSSQPTQAISVADLVNVIHQDDGTSNSLTGADYETDHQELFSETASVKRKGPNESNETQSIY
jgi:hypothetical protein